MKQGFIALFAVLITVTAVLPIFVQADSPQLRVWIPEYCGFKKGNVEFSIWVENEIPLKSIVFDLLFDETVFSGPGIFIDQRAHGCFMNWTSVHGGVRISVACDSIEAGSGPLVHIRSDEPEGLEQGKMIEFTVSDFNLSDTQGQSHHYENLTASLPVQ